MNIPSQKASDSQKKPHQNLPPDLAEQLGGELDLAAVRAVARHDLDHNGHYCSGVLILTGDRLGHFLQQKTKWEGEWFPLSDFTAAILVEGVGMGLLRILEGETLAAEYRFTLRYAREMSRLHRLLEQHVEKKDKRDEEPFPPPHDRKKIRCEKCDRIIPPWSKYARSVFPGRKCSRGCWVSCGPINGRPPPASCSPSWARWRDLSGLTLPNR